MNPQETGGAELPQLSATHGPQGSVVAAPQGAEAKSLLQAESFSPTGRRIADDRAHVLRTALDQQHALLRRRSRRSFSLAPYLTT